MKRQSHKNHLKNCLLEVSFSFFTALCNMHSITFFFLSATIVACLPQIFMQTLKFGEITTISCSEDSVLYYNLTMPEWPHTPATEFVIVLKTLNTYYPVTATLDSTTWSVLADSQYQDVGELWVCIFALVFRTLSHSD